MSEKRFAIRTVKNGTVRIAGVTYRPEGEHLPYDGRLDGLRLAFGRYVAAWLPGGYEPFVSLWGTEAALRCRDEAEQRRHFETDPQVVNGSFPWLFWRAM